MIDFTKLRASGRATLVRVVPTSVEDAGQVVQLVLSPPGGGPSTRVMLTLANWSKALGKPGTNVEARLEQVE